MSQFIKDLIIEYNSRFPEEKEKRRKLLKLKEDEDEEQISRGRDCCGRLIYYPFPERFKARLFPWYIPMFSFRKKKKKKIL